MPEYRIGIGATVGGDVFVEAENEAEAERIANEKKYFLISEIEFSPRTVADFNVHSVEEQP